MKKLVACKKKFESVHKRRVFITTYPCGTTILELDTLEDEPVYEAAIYKTSGKVSFINGTPEKIKFDSVDDFIEFLERENKK